MRRIYPGILLVITAGLILFTFSCSPGSCLDETEAFVKTTFFSMETGKSVIPDSLTVYGIGLDTNKIYDKTTKVSIAELPLYAADNSCKFIIRINGISDTAEFRYSSYPHLLSKECGYTFYYTLDTVVHSINIIDHISVIKKTITTLNENNMQIFY